MNKYRVTTTDGNAFMVEAWSESKVIWAMSYEGYDANNIVSISKI
jgi:hypothetical protein